MRGHRIGEASHPGPPFKVSSCNPGGWRNALAWVSTSDAASAVTVSGSLDPSDPTWDGCGSFSATGCNYDVVQFSVSVDGAYDFDAFYDGDTSLDLNLDGILEIYEGSFDPLSPGLGSIAFDDDGPGGSNTSQILGLGLTAGTTYFAVISSFSDIPTSFGQPNGPWELTIEGPGDVSVIPIPAAGWLMISALAGLGLWRRRSA